MAAQPQPQLSPKGSKIRLMPRALLCAVSVTVLMEAPAVLVGGHDIIKIATIGGMIWSAPPLVSRGLKKLAAYLDHKHAQIPIGLKGTGGFAESINDLEGVVRPSLVNPAHGAYWGVLKGKPIFTALPAVSLIVGTTGAGKDSTHQDINLFSVPGNKIAWDFKGDTTCKFADAFQRMEKIVYVLNADDQYEDILGESETYNPNCIITDNFWREDGLLDVHADLTEQGFTIYPEPSSEGEGGNKFFRMWSRILIQFSNLTGILINGENSNLADALAMLQDRDSLLNHALLACGRLEQEDGSTAQLPIHESPWAEHQSAEDIASFAEYYANLGSSIADLMEATDQRTFDSFISGAIGEMADLNPATRTHKKSKSSSFRYAELKDDREDGKDVIAMITGSETRMDALAKFFELNNSAMLKELARHPNKQKPVTLFLNEITNFKFKELTALMTWCRAYNIRLVIYVQSLDSYAKTYTEHGLKTLMSEAEIKLFLPKQRAPETISFLNKTLSEASYRLHSRSGKRTDGEGLDSSSYSEEAWPVMTEDQIRRTDKGILFLSNNRPALVDLPTIAEIAPFRRWQGVSPFYGKKFLKPVTHRFWRYYPWMPNVQIAKGIARTKSAISKTIETMRSRYDER